jgi:hypothetical protein
MIPGLQTAQYLEVWDLEDGDLKVEAQVAQVRLTLVARKLLQHTILAST